MSVKGTNFRERQRRLIRAYYAASKANDAARLRTIRLAFYRLVDHIRASKDL